MTLTFAYDVLANTKPDAVEAAFEQRSWIPLIFSLPQDSNLITLPLLLWSKSDCNSETSKMKRILLLCFIHGFKVCP